MAEFYVDAVSGSSSNSGAAGSPKQYLSELPRLPNMQIFLRAGQTHPIAGYRFLLSGSSIDRYGEGPRPILQKTAGGDAWIYVQSASNVRLRNFVVDCNRFKGAGVALSANKGHAISDVSLEDVEVFGALNHVGVSIAGYDSGTVRNVSVERCVVHHCFSHGFICSTDVRDVLFVECLSHDNGFGVGSHGFTAWGAKPEVAPSYIRWMRCRAHHTIDADGIEGQGFQADDNSSECAMIDCISHDNQGAGFALNQSRNSVVSNCVAYGNGGAGIAVSNHSPNPKIVHNRLVNNMRTKTGYSAINVSGVSPGTQITDNTIVGVATQRGIYIAQTTSPWNEERNLLVGLK